MFLELLKQELLKNSSNYYIDNYDSYTFGDKKPFKKALINSGKRIFFSKPALTFLLSNDFLYKKVLLGSILKFDKYLEPLEFFYNNLASQESKELFLNLVAFRLLGYVKVRLPLSSPVYWNGIKAMENIQDKSKSLDVPSFPWKLYLHDMHSAGFPIKVYLNSKAAYTTFVVQQYIKNVNGKSLGPNEGDIVLDLGGCYGDTSIFFSHLIGKQGKVYTFEFIPGNLSVFNKNLALNPALKDNIEIVQHPIWDTSDKKIYFKDAGAASHISFNNFEGSTGKCSTITIDDFVSRYNIQKLNFIKADIEGAEPNAIKGAINTLKRFTPTLALSIYHSMGDFTGIIKQIDDLKLGYKFYLGHYTIYASETILYAVKE